MLQIILDNNIDIEPSIINSVVNSEEDDIKESPFSQSEAHKIKISDTNTYGVNEVQQQPKSPIIQEQNHKDASITVLSEIKEREGKM